MYETIGLSLSKLEVKFSTGPIDNNKKSSHVDKFLLLNLIYSLGQKYLNKLNKILNSKVTFCLCATIIKSRSY